MTRVLRPLTLALRGRWRRGLLWTSLLLLLAVAQGLLVLLTVSYESTRAQDQTEAAALEVAAEVKRQVTRAIQDLQPLTWPAIDGLEWGVRADQLLQARRELLRVETRGLQGAVLLLAETRFGPPPFAWVKRSDMGPEIETACAVARRTAAPAFTRSYYVPFEGGTGFGGDGPVRAAAKRRPGRGLSGDHLVAAAVAGGGPGCGVLRALRTLLRRQRRLPSGARRYGAGRGRLRG
jgi:hypothetical protein